MSLTRVRKLIAELPLGRQRRVAFFKSLAPNEQAFLLLEAGARVRRELLSALKPFDLSQALHYLDPDEVALVLHGSPSHVRSKLLDLLTAEVRTKVQYLLGFKAGTAGSLMSLDYVEAERDETFIRTARIVERHERATGRFPIILVVDDGYLQGELSGHVFALTRQNEKIGKYVRRIAHVRYDASERDVLKAFHDHRHGKVVVLDDDESILGVIFADDVLKRLHRRSASSLYGYAGVHEEEDVLDSTAHKVFLRHRWLLLHLFLLFIAAYVVASFRGTIEAFVLLAVYMPVVAAMGGTTATQTLAVVIRGLVLREIDAAASRRLIVNEALSGLVNGAIVGVVIAAVAFFFHGSPLFGLVLGLTMVLNLCCAGLFGAVVPLVITKFGRDPALSGTIFIATLTDIVGFVIFLSLASVLL